MYLVFALLGRIFQPTDTGKNGGGEAHEKVGNHFAVIVRADRNNAVQNAENHYHNLPDEVPFCNKNQGSHAKQGGN